MMENKMCFLNLLLQPTAGLIKCPILQDRVLQLLLQSARRDHSAKTRCTSLCQLGQWLLWRLSQQQDTEFHPRITEVLRVLLQSLQFQDQRSRIASIACDALKLCTERGEQLAAIEQVPQLIIQALCKAIAVHNVCKPNEARKMLLTTLMLCLGEFCMVIPAGIMLHPDDSLIEQVLRVLLQVATGAATADAKERFIVDPDFDMHHIELDLQAKRQQEAQEQAASVESCQLAISICARAVVMQLVTQLHHFPLTMDASCRSSMVMEHDDNSSNAGEETIQQLERRSSELPSVLTAANLQMFMIHSSQLASFIELPKWEKGQAQGLLSSAKQVRVLTRDLSGKACWDATLLYREQQHPKLEPVAVPAQFGNTFIAPTLPLDANKLQKIDKLICQLRSQCLPEPKDRLERQAIASILEQRVQEQQQLEASTHASSFYSKRSDLCPARLETPFLYCRLFFAHLGLLDAQHRSRTQLLRRSEKLMRELRNVDMQKCRETHKLAVIYVGAGQEDKTSILLNTNGSRMYERFVASLGWEIDLMTHNGFLGGFPRQGCGSSAPYYATPFLEVMYHVATRMPSDSSEAMLLKTRHIGNDEVHIVWSEHERDYTRDIFPTKFCDVLIVIYPLGQASNLYRVQVNRKPEVPCFGPLAQESLVSGACLATLVRATAINASRTKRASLPLYQQFYEERNRSLNSVFSHYKEHATFEDFTSRLYNPLQPPIEQFVPKTPVLEENEQPRAGARRKSIFKLTKKHSLQHIVVDKPTTEEAPITEIIEIRHPPSRMRRMSLKLKSFLHHPTVYTPSPENETQPDFAKSANPLSPSLYTSTNKWFP